MGDQFDQAVPKTNPPKNIDEAVDRLISELPLKARVQIARMAREDILYLQTAFGPYVRNNFWLWAGSEELLMSCRILSGQDECHVDTASAIIIDALWGRLRKSHGLRLVK